VWSPLVVVSQPLPHNGPKVPFIQQNQPIQTLTAPANSEQGNNFNRITTGSCPATADHAEEIF
jgi:hypothetical protein